MEPFATINDLAAIWRPFTNRDEEIKAEAWIAAASRMIRRLFPDVETQILLENVNAASVKDVVCFMVRRVMVTTSGAQVPTNQLGQAFDAEPVSDPGSLYLTNDERSVFAACTGYGGRFFGTVSLAGN